VTIALDATYSIGDELSGVGLYSREILYGLAAAHPKTRFEFCYRPHRYFRVRKQTLPPNVRRWLLWEGRGQWSLSWRRSGFGSLPSAAHLFHGLNQRLPRHLPPHTAVTFHDLFVMTGDYSTPEFRARFTQQARDAAARADAIIAVSAFTKRQVVELLGVPSSKVHVVHHGTRCLAYPDVQREKIVLSVGAIQTRKNTARLIEAFETLDSSWRLVLAGSAGFGAEPILARAARNSRILVTGYVSPEILAAWYARAMIFAFPSLDEGFGMPVLEAMAIGTPVITSNRSALPEVAGRAAILVDPEDSSALAEALRQLAANEDLRRQYGERGIERAREFTWGKAVRRTWDVYQMLLSGSLRRPQS
jgi:glycosyltransferase involved in cell wall biosynthesis